MPREEPRSTTGEVRAAFVGALGAFRDLVTDEAVTRAWQSPSVLKGYTVAGLAGHVLSTASAVERYLDVEQGNEEPIPPGDYYASIPSPVDAAELHEGIRARGAHLGDRGQTATAEDFDSLIDRLRERLATEPASRTLVVMGGITMKLDDYLETRIVELAVHLDDLATTVGVAPGLPPESAAITAEHLFQVARTRHGDLAVIRGFARQERDDIEALNVF